MPIELKEEKLCSFKRPAGSKSQLPDLVSIICFTPVEKGLPKYASPWRKAEKDISTTILIATPDLFLGAISYPEVGGYFSLRYIHYPRVPWTKSIRGLATVTDIVL